jgi:hypothetical protein
MKKPVIIVALAVSLAGCGNPPDSGTVVGRSYTPPDTYMTTSCHLINKSIMCIPQDHYEPPMWSLRIKPVKGDTDWRDVDQTEYDHCSTGEQYPQCVKDGM